VVTRRPDDEIVSEIYTRLLQAELLGRSEIGVAVTQGRVEISGSVWTEADRQRVGEIARSVPGVVEVVNRLATYH
jgi:osmotically-inducible protein OsmY